MKRSDFRYTTILLAVLLFSTALAAGQNISRTFSWKYNINNDARVGVENYDCNLSIHSWNKAEAEFHLTIEAETRTAEDAAVLEKFVQNLVFSNSPSSADFRTIFWESRNTVLNRTTMKLPGGKSIALKSFEIKGELWVPSTCNLLIDSKYSRVSMENFAGNLKLDLYNNNLTAGNITAPVDLTDKYSTTEFGDLKDLHATLYNSKLIAGKTGNLDIDSKYSVVNIAACGKISVNSYNDKFEIPKTDDLRITAKYTDLRVESSGPVVMDMYNGTVRIGELKDLKIASKYGEYQFSKTGNCTISSSYNDKLTFGSVLSLHIDESKYTTFKAGNLAASVEDRDSYNDNFTVASEGKEFTGLKLSGKYTSVSLGVPNSTSYRLKADIQYGDLKLDESALRPVVKIIDGNNTRYEAIKGTESAGMPVIEVKGYQISLKISDR